MIDIVFHPGDVIQVYQKIKEIGKKGEEKERLQMFEGTVLGVKGRGENKSFMVRKVVDGVAVERIWPLFSPLIDKVVLKEKPKKALRRAKLYYLRKNVHA